MKITSIAQQKYHKNMYSVFVDNNYSFSLEDIDLIKIGLQEGQEITKDDIEHYKNTYEYSRAKEKALKYISYRRRTYSEVEKKLKDLGYDDTLINKVLEHLVNLYFIDDSEYTKAFITEKVKLNPCGKKLISHELKNKGINSDIIIKELEESNLDEYNLAYNLVLKKIKSNLNIDKKQAHKIYAMLLRKGFSSSTALKVLRDLQ